DPPELGRIDIRMEVDATGRLQAQLAVETSEAMDLLARDAKALERALQQAGLNLDRDSLSFSMSERGARDGHADGRNSTGGHDGGADADEPILDDTLAHTPLSDGRAAIDIRV
ncbi:MAG: flagellar hook-length control protein FliK, partial [Pseudomonadota bacterium]